MDDSAAELLADSLAAQLLRRLLHHRRPWKEHAATADLKATRLKENDRKTTHQDLMKSLMKGFSVLKETLAQAFFRSAFPSGPPMSPGRAFSKKLRILPKERISARTREQTVDFHEQQHCTALEIASFAIWANVGILSLSLFLPHLTPPSLRLTPPLHNTLSPHTHHHRDVQLLAHLPR